MIVKVSLTHGGVIVEETHHTEAKASTDELRRILAKAIREIDDEALRVSEERNKTRIGAPTR